MSKIIAKIKAAVLTLTRFKSIIDVDAKRSVKLSYDNAEVKSVGDIAESILGTVANLIVSVSDKGSNYSLYICRGRVFAGYNCKSTEKTYIRIVSGCDASTLLDTLNIFLSAHDSEKIESAIVDIIRDMIE